VAKFWPHDKKLKSLNLLTTAVFWTIWQFRNEMCFQGRQWLGMKMLMGNAGRLDDPTMTRGGDDPGRVAIKTTGFILGPSYLSAKRCRTW
jgi:hypothetical protein